MSRKLLLADDSVTIQKVIGITFVNEDYTLAVADNGDAALEKARSDRPDLILADVFMPGKNGYELCAAVKADPSLADVPVLLLTGTFEPFDEAKARDCGADGWIGKPFESQALIGRVKELLDKAVPAPAAVAAPAASEPVPEVPPAAEPPVEADIWTELAESEPVPGGEPVAAASREEDFSAIFTGDVEEAVAPPATESAEDIWSEVSLVEEDLAPATEVPAVTSLPENIWTEMETPAAFASVAEEVAPSPTSVGNAAPEEAASIDDGDEVMELAEEDILALDDEDILVDEPVFESAVAADDDFVFVSEETAAEFAGATDIPPLAEDIFAFADEPAPLAAEGIAPEIAAAAPEAAVGAESPSASAEEFVLSPEEPEVGAEGLPAAESFQMDDTPIPEPEMPVAEPAVEVPEQAVAEAAPVVAPAPAVAAEAPVAFEAVEERARALSEAELERIVERVAKTVIERLAGTILEKIAWEVVPDLAESLIKEELRQIKAEAEQTS